MPTNSVDVYFAKNGETGTIFYGAFTQLSKGWNDYEMQQALAALEAFSAVCNVTFGRTFDRADAEFTLLLGGNNDPDASFGGFFASPGTIAEGIGVFGGGRPAIANHSWADVPGGALEKGGFGWQLLLHEFGHGLGLAHPHDDGGASVVMNGVSSFEDPGDYGLNLDIFTVMSLRLGGDGPDGRSPSDEYGYVAGPMAFDIALLQEKYGANETTHAGNDVYLLPDRNQLGTFYSCIWDTDGIDTISAGPASAGCTINLNDATLRYEPGGGGFVSSAKGIWGGFTIANGVVLENATGGSRGDTLIGNETRNTLAGLAGDDRISGGRGGDILLGGAGDDIVRGNQGADKITGGRGADKLYAGLDDSKDEFIFASKLDSGKHGVGADRIYEFDRKNGSGEMVWDRINLSRIDADDELRGDQPLRFVTKFGRVDDGTPEGQVQIVDLGADVNVRIDVDGDNIRDMIIKVVGVGALTSDDFIL